MEPTLNPASSNAEKQESELRRVYTRAEMWVLEQELLKRKGLKLISADVLPLGKPIGVEKG
jgi:hypothetical protein